MSMSFRSKFGCKIVAIIDCFELFNDRPGNLSAQAKALSKATILQNFSLVLLLKEQFALFQRDGEVG